MVISVSEAKVSPPLFLSTNMSVPQSYLELVLEGGVSVIDWAVSNAKLWCGVIVPRVAGM